jgi:hypothetical protein
MQLSDLKKLNDRSKLPTKFKAIPRDTNRTLVGLGGPIDDAKFKAAGGGQSAEGTRAGLVGLGLIDLVSDSMDCAPFAMDTIHQTRWTLEGPITDLAIEKNFSAEIDLFANSKSVEGVSYVESTMPQNGELNTHMLACAIGFHLEPEPYSFTVQGNAVTKPIVATAKPPSPDVYTVADVFNGAIGSGFAGANPEQIIRPAVLEWGMWANYVAWHMVRAYNLRWAIGTKNNILDEVLRHTAYMPPSAQDGSSGNSQIDVLAAVRRTNDYYGNRLATAMDFLKVDFLRLGALTIGGANIGDFRPSRAYELAGVTYGGGDLRHMLKGNSEFRKLKRPYIIGAGIPIGLRLDQVDDVQGDIMRDYLSATQGRQGNGVVPPAILDAANFTGPNVGANGIGTTPVMAEQSIDCPPTTCTNFFQQVFAERILFKMGDLKLSLLVQGRELDGDLYQFLLNNPGARDQLCTDCECSFAKV